MHFKLLQLKLQKSQREVSLILRLSDTQMRLLSLHLMKYLLFRRKARKRELLPSRNLLRLRISSKKSFLKLQETNTNAYKKGVALKATPFFIAEPLKCNMSAACRRVVRLAAFYSYLNFFNNCFRQFVFVVVSILEHHVLYLHQPDL